MAHILVVDDESNIRLMLRLALQASGHSVQSASDGLEALDLFGDGHAFDLVLLDQRMPAMQGLDVLRALKSRNANTKVIMATAFGTVDLALDAKRAGATHFLRKPFTTDILRGAVEAALCEDEPLNSTTDEAPDTLARPLGGVAVNGFRLRAAQTEPQQSRGALTHRFSIVSPGKDETTPCAVLFSPVFIELVKAHADRDALDPQNRFWLWLAEEALANYLWQNAAPPPDETLRLEELSPNLRRWMDALGPL